MKDVGIPEGQTASGMIDRRLAELDDWRGAMLARLRNLIKETDPDVVGWKGAVSRCLIALLRQIRSKSTVAGFGARLPVKTLPLSVKISLGGP